eukprot:TRINITY_DN5686_c0_g1_i1.p1 TRINITY_DN5686_c0_g1~~TRINITY_DN5686_c0_g1_i1.p1  ORF type:complete len:283 (-),score=87.98 TRINITY_DN5686_c0_g1_i1:108-956(-)
METHSPTSTATVRPFGSTGLKLFPIGLGTIWFGRPWPPKNDSYTDPSQEEIDTFMLSAAESLANSDGVFMVDTAAAYGTSEQRLGTFFGSHPELFAKAVIATKFGGSYEKEVGGEFGFDPSLASLVSDFDASVRRLGRVDLLYYHLVSSLPFEVSMAALRNAELTATLRGYRAERRGGLRWLGASISDPKVFVAAYKEGLLDFLDVLQIPMFFPNEVANEIEALFKAGKAIVLNSPIRYTAGKQTPFEAYRQALTQPHVSMVLSGTRTHLAETAAYPLIFAN